ncbi:type II secretion system protein [Planctomycetota bacterium]
MNPNTLITNVATCNGTSAGSLGGRYRLTFTLAERRPWSQRFGGFTLVELLVVIAIIAMLQGLLVPGLHWAKKIANEMRCRAYLKGLYVALIDYTDLNEGLFPDVTDPNQAALQVKQALQPYASSEKIFWCPEDPGKPAPLCGSYGWRVTDNPKASLAGVRLDLIRHPERVIIAGERSSGWHKSEMRNVLYLDGHVGQVTKEEFLRNITTPLESQGNITLIRRDAAKKGSVS